MSGTSPGSSVSIMEKIVAWRVMEKYGVSRTPVREALIRLAEDRMV
ncbi:GntR family transcriptional regulator, partial [Brucella melitensis]